MPSLIAHAIAVAPPPTNPTATTSAINCTGANFIVVAVGNLQTNTTQVSDSSSNTWTPLTVYDPSGAGASIQLFYVQAPTVSSSQTFSATDSLGVDTSPAIAVAAFSGIASSPFDVQSGAAPLSNVNSIQPGSITPGRSGELLITAVANSTTTSDSVDSGFTITDGVASGANNFGLTMAYLVQSTAAAINPTWTLGTQGNTSDNNGVTIAAFKAVLSNDIPWGFASQPLMTSFPQIVSV